MLVGLIAMTAPPALAQMSLEVSPIRAEHQIEAGASETNIVSVHNAGPKPTRVKVSLQDWQMNRKGEVSFARAGSTPGSLSSWMEINPTDFRVEPGETKEIRYTLTIPAGARTGGYRGALIVEGMPAQPGPPTPKKMAVHGRFGVMIYETVGKPDIRAKFTDFQVLPEKGTDEICPHPGQCRDVPLPPQKEQGGHSKTARDRKWPRWTSRTRRCCRAPPGMWKFLRN